MTILNLKFHEVFRILEIGGIIICTWPHNPDARKLVYILREIYWWFCVSNAFIANLAFINTIYLYRHNMIVVMRIFSEFASAIEVSSNMIIYRLQKARIQHLLKELKDFHATNDHERTTLQKYIDRYMNYCIFILIFFIVAIIIFASTPIFQSRKLPAEILYPFVMESSTMISILYINQLIILVQIGLGICLDFMYVMLLLHLAARLEILCFEIRNTTNRTQMHLYIKKHQEIIKFANETKHVIQLGLFKTNILMALAAITAIFPIIHSQSLWISLQFIFITVGGGQRLYVTAWPAADLMENSMQVAKEIYNMSWIGRSQSFTKDILFVMQRSQKPLLITMGGLLPALSLSYYSTYVIGMFSYSATIRAIIGDH